MAGPIPLLNFAPYNPVGTALDAALGTYQGILQGKNQKTQNQLQQAKVPYAQQMAKDEAMIKSVEADYAKKNAESGYQKAMTDLERAKVELEMYPQSQQAAMNYQNAQAGLARAEAGIKNFQLENPGLLGGAQSKDIAGLLVTLNKMKEQGLIQPQGAQPQQGTVDIEPVGGMNQQPSGQSFSREDVMRSMPQEEQAPRPYEALEKAIYNNIERMSMQPWEIKGKEKMAEQEAIQEHKMLGTMREESDAALQTIPALQQLNDNFTQLLANENETWSGETGQLFGRLPPRSKEAQLVDQSVAQLLQTAQKAWTGSLSDSDISNILKQFPNRTSPASMQDISDYIMAANLRALEKQDFMEQGLNEGKDIAKLQSEWNRKSVNYSVYDEVKRMHDLEKKAGMR